ncbi:MAG TPA: hypothetical protein VFB96_09055 [Pirellulaceae bacterium]|jgi:hypothetical protein|nr:hypothetical protein [Pirellulaceae bacterium]
MRPGILAPPVATFCVLVSLASVALADSLTLEKAQEISKQTGRPILAVAGSKT